MSDESEIVRRLCDALGEPYGADDGHGVRYHTLDEVVAQVAARTRVWSDLLIRIEEVDPSWLDAYRRNL